MKESDTYQAILEEGKIEGKMEASREHVLRLGRRKFGPPPPAVQSALEVVSDVERLDRLVDRILDASNWEDLLATP